MASPVLVLGCGPVGQFAMQSAWMFGAERVIGIDRVPERLRMAEQHSRAETINFDEVKVYDRLMEMTSGRGPDRCIDAVGAEAHGSGSFDAIVDKANGPYVLENIGSSDKRLLALPDSSHEVTLDVDRERIMVEAFDFIRAHSKE